MKSILYSFTPVELQVLLDSSNGYSDLLRKIGLNPKGNNPDTLKSIIKEYNLDTKQMDINRRNVFKRNAKTYPKNEYDLDDILCGKYPNYQSSKLLKRLVDTGYKKNMCEICGIKEWNNKPLSFHLHHIDGDHKNNNINNLQVLCPNCHSQTETFAGKSSRDKSKQKSLEKNINDIKNKISKLPPVERSVLKEKIRNIPFTRIAEEYGVSDNAIRKWCKKYNLPSNKNVIKKISDNDWLLI